MVLLRKKFYGWLFGILVIVCLLIGCTPEASLEEGPSPTDVPTKRNEPKPSRTLPATIDISSPTPVLISAVSETPSPSVLPGSKFEVCDQANDGGIVNSPPSQDQGLSVNIDSLIPPAPPATASYSLSGESVTVTWQGTGTDVDEFYNIYRFRQGEGCWEIVGREPVEGQNQGGYTFIAIMNDQEGEESYAVTTVDIYKNESALSIAEEQGP